MENTVLSVVAICMMISTTLNQRYRNDERWQAIKAKVNEVVSLYFHYLGKTIALGLIVLVLFIYHNYEGHLHLDQVQVGLGYALLVGLFLISMRDVVEVIAFKYFDNKM